MDTNSCETKNHKFICENCDYTSSRKSSLDKHKLSAKHINRTKMNKIEHENSQINKFICKICQKKYKVRNSLWYHEIKCKKQQQQQQPIVNDMSSLSNLIVNLIKSNTDLQKQMLEVCQTNTVINNNNHSNNKTFNLNFFLNEQCKDAMNIMDFVDTFKLDFADLDSVGKLGYVEGISNIIIQKLNEMDIYKRPIHCSDLKRETTHVKDQGVWEKDNGNHDKLRLAIQHVTHKNIRLLNPWIEAHPQAQASTHYLNDVYMNYVKQSMGGKGDLDDNESKIIRKIAKVVLIDK